MTKKHKRKASNLAKRQQVIEHRKEEKRFTKAYFKAKGHLKKW